MKLRSGPNSSVMRSRMLSSASTWRCPICGTDNALSIVGAQSASLSSVAISYIYTSPLNQDKKLLAFTDSVQDASHRAAFFGARTYRFNLRTAWVSACSSRRRAITSASCSLV